MNTDNMSILGLTIDYGPYGLLENYDKGWTPNTTDRQHKRYRYGNQPMVAQWNLFQLANALFPLIGDAKPLESALERYVSDYDAAYIKMMRLKLGLKSDEDRDNLLVDKLEETLSLTETDMTIFFRNLSTISPMDQPKEALAKLNDAFYDSDIFKNTYYDQWQDWIAEYIKRIARETISDEHRKEIMNAINPKYVLRNYMAQLAIDAAKNGNYDIIEELYQVLKYPYAENPQYEKWFAKRPDWARHKIGCSMLSCSS